MNGAELVEPLAASIELVANVTASVTADTTLEQTGVDSVGLLEAMVYLEDAIGCVLDEDLIRSISLDPRFDMSITVHDLAELIGVRLDAVHDGDRLP